MKLPKGLLAVLRILPFALAALGVAAIAVVIGARLGVEPAASVLQMAVQPAAAAAAPQVEPLPTQGIMYLTTERTVNLADKGTMRYIKAQVVLEIASPGQKVDLDVSSDAYVKLQDQLKSDLASRSVAMEDEITMVISGKTAAELVTPDGKVHLKQELKDHLNKLVGDRQVLNVYFTDFIIQ